MAEFLVAVSYHTVISKTSNQFSEVLYTQSQETLQVLNASEPLPKFVGLNLELATQVKLLKVISSSRETTF